MENFTDHAVFTWPELCANAEVLHLERAEFEKLEPFFAKLPPEFFRECAAQALTDFPFDKAQAALNEAECRKLYLLAIVANYGNLKELYRVQGYPAVMLEEICCDLKVWIDTFARDFEGYGITGEILGWERACFTGAVKQFGRLQINDIHSFFARLSLYRQGNDLKILPAFERKNPPHPDLSYMDKTVNLHIPASGALTRAACIDSFRRIRRFMQEFHPDYDWKAFVCYSWILDAQFQAFLKPGSNILEFQRLGHLFDLPGSDENATVLWRIWGDLSKKVPVSELPARTSMERGAANFLQNGGHFREGIMVIFRDEVNALCKE